MIPNKTNWKNAANAAVNKPLKMKGVVDAASSALNKKKEAIYAKTTFSDFIAGQNK